MVFQQFFHDFTQEINFIYPLWILAGKDAVL